MKNNYNEQIKEKWENYLYFSSTKNYNVEHLKSIKENSNRLVYEYVLRSLNILDSIKVSDDIKYYVRETLRWMDVAKTGTNKIRKEWKKKGYNLYVHNIGSSQIYKDESNSYNEIVRILIKTHGLIGQNIRGEVSLNQNKELYDLLDKNLIEKEVLKEVLVVLNECVVGAVSKKLYERLKDEINYLIEKIINNNFEDDLNITKRIDRLNGGLSSDEKQNLNDILKNEIIKDKLNKLFDTVDFWYYEIALNDFSILEQIKILLICFNEIKDAKHLTFEKIMKSIYLDYNGKRTINLFKKRIVEEYLKNIEIQDIINNRLSFSPHINFNLIKKHDTLLFDFKFSIQASKLIEFCMVASNSNSLYKKSIYLLYDLFGFRKDEYDRFYNEIDYLNTMNASLQFKAKILDYMKGKNILDVGPGGGALMDLICERNPFLNVYGIDISSNVIDALTKKKLKENKTWNLVKGDALNLTSYFKKGSIDTIIYSSIIHELYSYIEFEGKKFNIKTVIEALKSAYEILPVGGRIIIRDGIKTEPVTQYRIIEFKNEDDNEILNRYCNDFEGRKITYERLDSKRVKMLVNDAMEFLYTYTWGEDSYPLEVKEQFGYLTPTEYINLIKENLEYSNVLVCNAYLQEGYEENLLNKISIYDDNMNQVKLPNSTCIIVIEKQK